MLAVDSQASNERMAVTIDEQLAGASGTGERPYRSGPWRPAPAHFEPANVGAHPTK